jgi:coproporphyrinogen III oxidase-like Fe-S oxidoreductase
MSAPSKTALDIVHEATRIALEQDGYRHYGSSHYSEDGCEIEAQHWTRSGERVSVLVKEHR